MFVGRSGRSGRGLLRLGDGSPVADESHHVGSGDANVGEDVVDADHVDTAAMPRAVVASVAFDSLISRRSRSASVTCATSRGGSAAGEPASVRARREIATCAPASCRADPGSMMICSCPTPARTPADGRARSAMTSATRSSYRCSARLVHEHERHAVRGRDTRMPSSSPTPPDVIHEIAPAAEGSPQDDRLLSYRTLRGPLAGPAELASITGHHPTDLVVGGTSTCPGRVDSPPTSSISAPSRTIDRAWTTAAGSDRKLPASAASFRRRQRIGEEAVTGERVGVTLRYP